MSNDFFVELRNFGGTPTKLIIYSRLYKYFIVNNYCIAPTRNCTIIKTSVIDFFRNFAVIYLIRAVVARSLHTMIGINTII